MGRINAGSLTERVALHYPGVATPDGQGGFVKGSESVTVVYAAVKVLSGRESIALGQTLAGKVLEVTVRLPRQVDVNTTTLTWLGNSYNIQRADPDSRREFLTLLCVDNGRN